MTDTAQRRAEYRRRQTAFQRLLAENGLDGAMIVEAADLVYLTGTHQNMHLYVPAEGQPLLMVRRDLNAAREDALVDNIVPLRSFRDLPRLMAEAGLRPPARLGLEFDILPVAFFQQYQRVFPETRFADCSAILRRQRAVKSDYERMLLREAGRRMDALYARLPEVIAVGRGEAEAAGRFEALARTAGHQGLVRMRGFNAEIFWGHFLAGESAARPGPFDGAAGGPGPGPAFRFGSSGRPIMRDEPILVDYPGVFDGYLVDITRIVVVGRLSAELVRAHEVALEIQEHLVREARPGATAGALYDLALGMARDAGLDAYFMGYGNPVPFVGHGVGIELNEWPVIARGAADVLEEGHVLALEPKFVFPGQGMVGIENTFIVGAAGLERITNFPDAVMEI
ncbi:MAG: Xaa-Pro peptidase family protein [Thermoanaerobacterales bacterium]|nr:Xaa-Pro peptidase family protein [Bacillota bacterium]MDI6906724.1 Xaa-Pro peptidase family protein [Thermoanaerobacterales bacterium]